MDQNYEREVAVAHRLAEEAGRLVLPYRSPDIRVELKAGDEPVTAADKAASDFLCREMSDAFPDDIIISEENTDDLRRLTAHRVWYIDPIDGTKDFIRGGEGFSVMIGLCVDGIPTIGIVNQPTKKQTFVGAPKTGAQLWRKGQSPMPLRVSAETEVSKMRLVASRSHRTADIDEVKSALGIQDEKNIGSVGLKLSLIALCERDLYVNPTPFCKAWDTCAPEAILVAAGGRITDLYGNALTYQEEEHDRNCGIVASNGVVHEQVIEKLVPLFSKR